MFKKLLITLTAAVMFSSSAMACFFWCGPVKPVQPDVVLVGMEWVNFNQVSCIWLKNITNPDGTMATQRVVTQGTVFGCPRPA